MRTLPTGYNQFYMPWPGFVSLDWGWSLILSCIIISTHLIYSFLGVTAMYNLVWGTSVLGCVSHLSSAQTIYFVKGQVMPGPQVGFEFEFEGWQW